MLVILGGRGVQEVGDKLPPAGLEDPSHVGPVPGLPVLRHDVLAVHGVVVALPGLNVPTEVLQLVSVG